MKKTINFIIAAAPWLLLSGCAAAEDKPVGQSLIYGAAALLSLFLLIGCCVVVKKKRSWFVLLFSSVLVVNIGYTLLSTSSCLEMALWANRLAYLGSVFLPLTMLMILLNVTGTKHPKWLHAVLGGLSVLIFLIAASPGILPIYYRVVRIIRTRPKVLYYGAFRPFFFDGRQPICRKEEQKSPQIKRLWGRRFLKERIFVQTRHKTQPILAVLASILT